MVEDFDILTTSFLKSIGQNRQGGEVLRFVYLSGKRNDCECAPGGIEKSVPNERSRGLEQAIFPN